MMNRRLIMESIQAIQQVTIAIFAWLIGFPLTFFVKRDIKLTVVIGRKGPVFADNSKYFFIKANECAKIDERVIFFTDDLSIQKDINDAGAKAVLHPSVLSLQLLMQCGTLVTDMSEWFEFGAYQLMNGAKRIQIWHGAPLKRIELDLYRERLTKMPLWSRTLLILQKRLIGRYPIYDMVIATSNAFIEAAFKRCFQAKCFVASGYPRNDILLGWPSSDITSQKLLNINVDNTTLLTVKEARANKNRICLYAPTFRNDMTNPFSGLLDLSLLSEFAVGEDILVVLKLHPFMKGLYSISQYPNLLDYDPLCDVYPIMPECDILITDYSSIYFDFLLLDRPIVFFAPDLDHYTSKDRGMYFNYDTMTPGAKCYSIDELKQQLTYILNNDGEDGYADNRAKTRAFTHDFVDNQAGYRLLEKSTFDEN